LLGSTFATRNNCRLPLPAATGNMKTKQQKHARPIEPRHDNQEITPVKSSPDWKPEPCGLSREEVRRIIAEQLG
jgi:hypothetical protein